ncbi:hypothetical protein Scep_023610 [Stephania cephalantha]|uniref:Uncharacterized protein n=1 Tax=Stephania cephalantha TaxID=152367 RepID=A0AAP0EV02_9MAGN
MQLMAEFSFGENPEEEYSNEDEFVYEEEIDSLFLYGDSKVDPIFFDEDFDNLDKGPKFDDDGPDFVEDKVVFGDDDFVIEVVSHKNPQAAELEVEAYPSLDEFASKISTLNLEHVRRLKSRLVALTRRVQKVRDQIEQLMDDDGDMAEMYLTKKKSRLESSPYGDQSFNGYNLTSGALPASAPVLRKLNIVSSS